jgi:hypothetical protein
VLAVDDVDDKMDVVMFSIAAELEYWLDVELDVEDWFELAREGASDELDRLEELASAEDAEVLLEETLCANRK